MAKFEHKKNTKIVATLGPITCDADSIRKLIDCGANIFRLNGSHNTLEWHKKVIETVREVDPRVPILVDIPGRKVRTALETKDHAFKQGETVIITTQQDYKSDDKVIANYPELHKDLNSGDTVLCDDAQFKFIVKNIEGQDIYCEAQNDGVLKSCKGINVPYVRLNTPLVTGRDEEVLAFCVENKVDFVGVSFVESGDHVNEVRKHLGDSGIEVIAKVENQFGMENLESILDEAFGILVDRGDLGAETEIFNLSIKQKTILNEAKQRGVPVIVATELLHHMTFNPFPTKAEINDVSNAVLDGGSAVMLSGETAVGRYPFECVSTMSQIIQEAEKYMYDIRKPKKRGTDSIPAAVASSLATMCNEMPITKVVAVTFSGYAVRMMSKFDLKQPLIVVTDELEKARKFNLFKGVASYNLDIKFDPKNTEHLTNSLHQLYEKDVLDQEDLLALTAVRFPTNNKMNFLEIHNMKDLVQVFNW